MKILYVGPLSHGGTCRQRMIALQELGHYVVGVDTTAPMLSKKYWLTLRIIRRLGYPPDLAGANAQILSYIKSLLFDILWVDKGLAIHPRTLSAIKRQNPACQLVHYSPDDMLNPRNQSKRYLAGLPLYDLHVTTKSYNVSELKEIGATNVFLVENAYDKYTHRPIALTRDEERQWGCDVGFIGAYERERFEMLLALAKAGVEVVVRGPGWETCLDRHPQLQVKPGWVLGDDYAKAIVATKINLCFLRKVNRDLQTTRSVEIPACGGLMLAERTEEHLALFEEGKEAEFFGDEKELKEKINYYLQYDVKREQIAAKGRERCLKSGYSNHERLHSVLEYLSNLT